MSDETDDATVLLAAISRGDQRAKQKLFSLMYDQLHALAHNVMKGEKSSRNVLQTTALIHEAYIRLIKGKDIHWRSRKHFFCVAARAMRRVLVGEARRRKAIKRGDGKSPISLDAMKKPCVALADEKVSFEDIVDLDMALEKFEGHEELKRLRTIVELRFFVGLTLDETAEVLGVSKGTVRRDWEFAKAWLQQELKGGENSVF